MIDHNELSEEIRKRMRLRNMSAEDMAVIAHMNVKTWYRTMNNPEMFRLGDLERICRYLGMKLRFD